MRAQSYTTHACECARVGGRAWRWACVGVGLGLGVSIRLCGGRVGGCFTAGCPSKAAQPVRSIVRANLRACERASVRACEHKCIHEKSSRGCRARSRVAIFPPAGLSRAHLHTEIFLALACCVARADMVRSSIRGRSHPIVHAEEGHNYQGEFFHKYHLALSRKKMMKIEKIALL